MRDMTDGVMIIDLKGEITYINPSGIAMLGIDDTIGEEFSYAEFMARDEENNDVFHQFILDAVYQKNKIHSGVAEYVKGKEKKKLRLSTSFVFDEEKKEKVGITVVFSDVSEVENLNKMRHDASIIFSVIMSCMCLYLLAYAIIDAIFPSFSTQYLTLIMEIMAIISMIIIIKTTSISFKSFNLRLTRPLHQMIFPVVVSAGGVLILALIKWGILQTGAAFNFSSDRFWDISSIFTFFGLMYPLTALIQEILARVMMQTSLNYVFTGKNANTLSIIVSSLIFMALHIAHGVVYMAGAFILLSALGLYYQKSRNIWGVTLIHYTFGTVIAVLGFAA